ncbi:MAG TPA: hypothetical protein VM686_39850 [Polyangiaceae bacterium]|jgi:hypothetical protein|nr:hypothetical protein [Polyangiaceae bacterium]
MRRHLETLKSSYVFIGLLTLGAGCSDYRTQRAVVAPVAAPGQATICVFRPHGLGASVVSPVSDNGAIVGATDNSSYFCYLAEPGPHRIKTADAPTLSLDAKEGKSYYLAHDLNVAADKLTRIKKESADALSAYCSHVEVQAAPQGVAILKQGQIARADLPAPVQARAPLAPPSAERADDVAALERAGD